MKKFLTHILLFAAVVGAGIGLAAPAASALSLDAASLQLVASTKDDVCAGVGLTGGNCGDRGTGLTNIIRSVITILSVIVGVVAVIMIVIGGLKYVTSGGDASKVSNAKNTIIYAIVGLIIAALAQVIVHFVLGELR